MDFSFICYIDCSPFISYITNNEDYVYSKLDIDEHNLKILFIDIDGSMITTIIFELKKYKEK